MSCWVVPTIAAELWGMPLGDVIGQINAGRLPSRVDYGFLLVDVAPNGTQVAPPPPRPVRKPPRANRRAVRPPPTFEVVGVAGMPPTLAEGTASAPILQPAQAAAPRAVPAFGSAAGNIVEPSEAELAALGTPEPLHVHAAVPVVEAIAHRPPAGPVPAGHSEPDDEAGPDPNFGEPDDGKPLDWRRARERVSSTRRRPPPRF